MDQELRRRSSAPRVVLWLGSRFSRESFGALFDDLGRLPLIAAFSDSADRSVERALLDDRDRVDMRYPVGVANLEALEALTTGQLPIYYLGGAGQSGAGQNKRKAARLRDAMLGELDACAEQRPLYCALGIATGDELAEMLCNLGTYDVDAPLFVVGLPEDQYKRAIKESQGQPDETPVLPLLRTDDWPALRDWAIREQVRLFLGDAVPSVRMAPAGWGMVDVPLGPAFADASLKIDDAVRIVTTQALHAPPGADPNALFEAFMAPDERERARSAVDDHAEWHAIDAGIPLLRSGLRERVEKVAEVLRSAGADPLRNLPIVWLPTEPGAGATSMLHQIAHAVAKRGHPTLVVKQQAEGLSARAVSELLNELRAGAETALSRKRSIAETPPEVPALLVLDAPHAGTEGLEDLPDQLTRRERRQVVTLWALPVEPGHARLPASMDAHEWYSQHALVHSVRRPRKTDVFLEPLGCHVGADELKALERHARELREKHGIGRIELRDSASWQDFQRRSRFKGLGVIHDAVDAELVDQFTAPEELFWPSVFHFLTQRTLVDPHQHYRDALSAVQQALGRDGTALLLQIAKASHLGLPLPDTALRDFLAAEGEPRPDATEEPAGHQARGGKAEVTKERIDQLREVWRGGRKSPALATLDAYQRVRRIVYELERLNLVRSLVLNGFAWLRMTHRAVARALLVAACEPTAELDGLGLSGEVEHCKEVLSDRRGYEGLRQLLRALTLSQSNVRFCELISLAQLQGTGEDDREDWITGAGEQRLKAYEELSPAIHQASRALLHHHANVLRYSVRFKDLTREQRLQRLHQAEKLLNQALDQPWISGRKDEHPAHLLTTMGFVRLNQAAQQEQAEERVRLETAARDSFETALTMLPDTRHTRLGLSELLMRRAEAAYAQQTDAAVAEAAGMAARVLQLLELEPTNERHRWYATKERAHRLFGDEKAMVYLQRLQERGVEESFLIVAERCLGFGDVAGAIGWLQPITEGTKVARNLRAARRLAHVYAQHDAYSGLFSERHRLLASVESSGTPLTPDEEFQLACLDYQFGRYARGASRFSALRAGDRSRQVSLPAWVLADEQGRPAVFTGRISQRTEGPRGWIDVYSRASGEKLFYTQFFVRRFGNSRPGTALDVCIRFERMGAQAVPARSMSHG